MMIKSYFNKQDIGMMAIVATIGCLAVLAGYWKFFLWDQVNDIYLQGWSVLSLFYTWHPHALRYLIVYPIYVTSDLLGVAPNSVFSWIGMIMVIAIPMFLFYTARVVGISLRFAQMLCASASIIYFVLAMFMNGRMIFAHLGVVILLFAIIVPMKIASRHLILLFALLAVIGALLCSVSTGVFSVAYGLLGVSLLYELFLIVKQKGQWLKVLLMVATLLIMTPWMLMGVNKNISFFGGGQDGAFEMLAHGSGQVFLESLRPDLVKDAHRRSLSNDEVNNEISPEVKKEVKDAHRRNLSNDEANNKISPEVKKEVKDVHLRSLSNDETNNEVSPKVKKVVGYASLLLLVMMILITPKWLWVEQYKFITGIGVILALVLGQLGVSTLTLALPIGLLFLSMILFEKLQSIGKFGMGQQ